MAVRIRADGDHRTLYLDTRRIHLDRARPDLQRDARDRFDLHLVLDQDLQVVADGQRVVIVDGVIAVVLDPHLFVVLHFFRPIMADHDLLVAADVVGLLVPDARF